jgi:hypothetical protein
MRTWRTTTSELMQIFREALIVLVPVLDRARIAWRSTEAYDDWDAIAQVLFHNIVVRSVQWSLPEDQHEGFTLPKYGTMYPSYRDLSFVQVVTGDGRLLAFHSFDSRHAPFDVIDCRLVAESGAVVSSDLVSIPIELATFAIRMPNGRVLTDQEVAL